MCAVKCSDRECLICVGTTCTCGACEDAHKPCTEQEMRFMPGKKPGSKKTGGA